MKSTKANMLKKTIFILSLISIFQLSLAQEASVAEYKHIARKFKYKTDYVSILDHSKNQDGYWTFIPVLAKRKVKGVIVFVHGYGGYNPLIYGAWIEHLCRSGYIIVYPRYQKNLYIPTPSKFVENTVEGLKNALDELERVGFNPKLWQHLDYVVHSYGGVISTNMVVNQSNYKIPPARNLMLCSPGSGPFKGGVLEDYKDLPEDINLILISSVHDITVGDVFARKVYNSTPHIKNKAFLSQIPFETEDIRITAGHNECYAPKMDYDNGIRNYTSKKALRVGKIDALDLDGYWALFDKLLEKGSRVEVFNSEFTSWPPKKKNNFPKDMHLFVPYYGKRPG